MFNNKDGDPEDCLNKSISEVSRDKDLFFRFSSLQARGRRPSDDLGEDDRIIWTHESGIIP
jgi:hypothetical protein